MHEKENCSLELYNKLNNFDVQLICILQRNEITNNAYLTLYLRVPRYIFPKKLEVSNKWFNSSWLTTTCYIKNTHGLWTSDNHFVLFKAIIQLLFILETTDAGTLFTNIIFNKSRLNLYFSARKPDKSWQFPIPSYL